MTEVNYRGPANANGWQVDEIIDAALQAFNNQRCGHAVLHDLRGGLQAVSSSLELLSRCAKSGSVDLATFDKASSLAKRALINHERSLNEMLDQLLSADDTATRVNIANIVEDLRRFMRSDCDRRGIRLAIHGDAELHVHMPPMRLRRVLSNLLTLNLDASPPGTELSLSLSRDAKYACIELQGPEAFDLDDSADPLLSFDGGMVPRAQLVLAGARRWLPKVAGRLEIATSAGTAGILRVYCPLSDT